MDEKLRFIEALLDKNNPYTMTELCRQAGVSRKTGYKWWRRFKQDGIGGLADLGRAPKNHPNATSEFAVKLIVGARRNHPTWGPRKLRAWLVGKGYGDVVPAVSTIGRILKREGLVRRQKRRSGAGAYSGNLAEQDQPNAVWAADFKGQFKLTSGQKCYPLTISDGFSRFLLRCDALERPALDETRKVFESAFHEFGLPAVIRTDNGTPFSSISGISVLSKWWIKLGILPERIERGKPTQNGRHERIHRTLKAEATGQGKTKSNHWAQQRVFDQFRQEYNDERPHEALDDQPPAAVYDVSSRTYPARLVEPTYDDEFEVQRVAADGAVVIGPLRVPVSPVLAREPVGLLPVAGGHEVHYGPLQLGLVNRRGRLVRGARPRTQRNAQGPW